MGDRYWAVEAGRHSWVEEEVEEVECPTEAVEEAAGRPSRPSRGCVVGECCVDVAVAGAKRRGSGSSKHVMKPRLLGCACGSDLTSRRLPLPLAGPRQATGARKLPDYRSDSSWARLLYMVS